MATNKGASMAQQQQGSATAATQPPVTGTQPQSVTITPPGVEQPKTEQPKTEQAKKPTVKLLLLSMSGQPRNRGGFAIPPNNAAPLVVDVATLSEADLAALEADPLIIRLRSDAPLTPETDIVRLKRS
jgi:hypothetical protein